MKNKRKRRTRTKNIAEQFQGTVKYIAGSVSRQTKNPLGKSNLNF